MVQPAKRSYDSPLRKKRALDTRRLILESAASLFTKQGFSATTFDQIAEKAGVATPTVYVVFGSKRGIVDELINELKNRTGVGDRFRVIMESHSSHEMLATSAAITRVYSETGGALISAIEAAAAADRDVGTVWIKAENSRRRGQTLLVEKLADQKVLQKGLTAAKGGEVLWALSSHGVYVSLVERCGWTPDQFEQWLLDTSKKVLLKE